MKFRFTKKIIGFILTITLLAMALGGCGTSGTISLSEMTEIGDYSALFSGIRQVNLRYQAEGREASCALIREESLEQLFALLKDIRIEKKAISQNISEDRDWGMQFMLIPYGADSGVSLCFSPDYTEYFVLNDVKPSYSHRIENPETIRAVLDFLAQYRTLEVQAVSVNSADEKISLSQPVVDLGVESQSLSVTWRNQADTVRSTGQYFYVYAVADDGALTKVEPEEERFWQDIGYVLEPGKDRVVTYNLTSYPFEENTRYRIFLGGDSQSDYVVEFITGNSESVIF